MYNAFVYAKVNNRSKVGLEEIINTFKNWNYLDDEFDFKLKILDAIFTEFKIDSRLHPYSKKTWKRKNNIISLKQNSK